MMNPKLRIEIWSDIVCPFCYIGLQQLNSALKQLPKDTVYEITWKGFLLNPNLQTVPGETLANHLARTKNQSLEWATDAMEQATKMAAQEGLQFNLENAVPANSIYGHQLLKYARQNGNATEVYSLLFQAYFTDGKKIDNSLVLKSIAEKSNLSWEDFENSRESLQEELENDFQEARILGIQGVPMMVINRKWGISGARGSQLMLKAFLQAIEEN